ncbi:MAG: DUF4982 domain-containing protein [Treponema sp.]
MRQLFNNGWQFAKQSIENPKFKDGEKPIILDPNSFYEKQPSDFKAVAIPHDWMISNAKDLYENSVGFYKKNFSLQNISGKKYALRFEAVYMNSAVYVNKKLAGVWKYGYTTFEFDITDFLKEDENEVEVVAVYQCPNSRWYSGAGIYRDVYLVTTEDARVANDGIYFTAQKQSEVSLPTGVWNIKIETEVQGKFEGCTVKHSIVSKNGKSLKLENESHSELETKTLAPAMGVSFNADDKIILETTEASVKNPEQWDFENPAVYILKTELCKNGKVIDTVEQHVGFKTVHFDCDKGCFLNGKYVKLHGACEHHDLGSLGSAFNKTALRRQFLKLKEMGINSIRTSHNPPAPEFMDLADEMGILIDDECFDMWEKPKTTYDYGNYFIEWHERDASSWVRRDRNHPCLLMWSIGNEIYDTHQGNGYAITHDLKSIVRRYDANKNGLVTIGSNYMEWEGAQHCAEQIDLAGYNYGERLYNDHHSKHATWCIYGSETSSTVQSRGIYHFPLSNRLLTYQDQQCSCLGNCSTNWGAVNSAWTITQDRDAKFCAGQYIWTGWDYIGEPTPYFSKNSFFGQIDTAGFEKDTFYEYVAGWVDYKKSPCVHILPYWDFNKGQTIDVRIYSNCPSVELFVNGISKGKKENDVVHGADLAASWQVPYEEGSITAVAYDENGKIVSCDEQKSFGDSEHIVLEVEECSADGMYFIDISTTDKNNVPVANARSRMFINVEGEATLAGVDNGDSTDYEEYQSDDGKNHNRRLFSNKLLAIVKASDKTSSFSVTVSSAEMKSSTLVFKDGKLEKTHCKESDAVVEVSKKEIPVRKIELSCTEEMNLSPDNKTVKVTAKIFPVNATERKLVWTPMMLEGVKSDCAEIKITTTEEGEVAEVTGVSDGSFRLTCTASNDKDYPEVISELEFNVSGVGKASKNPYEIVQACKCSSSSANVKLSFEGGTFVEQQNQWYCFDKVDFGNEGGDTITLPLFFFNEEVPLEVWQGVPDTAEGRLLLKATYKSPSWYNHYQSNTFVLSHRLFGVQTISIRIALERVSLQGFVFDKTAKSFAKLNALDSNSIIGDAFTRSEEENAVTGIGNNVVLEYDNMDFGEKAASKITICGFSHVDNTIHVKFNGKDGSENRIVEFAKNNGYEEKTISLEGVKGSQTVSFVFLPGSNFDFKWFKFE